MTEIRNIGKIAISLMQKDYLKTISNMTIEERAKQYSLKDFDGYYTGREKAVEEGYIAGAREQKQLTLKAFDEWLCRNSWITRDEGNRKPLKELRNIIQNI